MTNPIAAALGAQPGESLLDAARRVVAELADLRRVVNHECPIGAFDLATTWRAERAMLQDEIAVLQEQLRDREKDLTFEYAGRERAQAVLRDVAAYLGTPAEHPADDSGMRELAQKVQEAL